jgi:DNA-binding YbaB/EbfC family protein
MVMSKQGPGEHAQHEHAQHEWAQGESAPQRDDDAERVEDLYGAADDLDDDDLDAQDLSDTLGPGGLGGLLGGGGGLFGGILEEAQRMQAAMASAQQELAQARVEGSAGGGLVTATVDGGSELIALTINPEAVDPEDTETLADLVLAAVRDATTKARRLAEEKLSAATGGLGGMLGSLGGDLGGGFGGPGLPPGGGFPGFG